MATPTDEETQQIPLADIRDILLEHMPPQEKLKLMTQRLENDKRFDERCTVIESEITSLGLARS